MKVTEISLFTEHIQSWHIVGAKWPFLVPGPATYTSALQDPTTR